MTYRIEISPTAMADVEGIFLWMKDYSIDQAHRWVRGCYEIMLTLENPNLAKTLAVYDSILCWRSSVR